LKGAELKAIAARLMFGTAVVVFGAVCPITIAPARAERSEVRPVEDFAAIHDRAAAAYLAGEWDKALAGFNAAIALNAKSALAYYNRGNVHYAKGNYAAAIADFNEALLLDSKLPYAHMNRGNALSNLGRFDEALIDLDQAARLQPEISDVYFNRAIVHVRRRDVDKALADYELAIARDGHDQEAKAARQRLLNLIGEQGRTGPITDIDTARITTEIAHARHVEHFLRLASDSCLAHGDSLESLRTLALVAKWKAATPDELVRGSTPLASLDGGWTFTDRFGSYALIRSQSNAKPPVHVCSLSAQPVSNHMFEDMKLGFESRFKSNLVDVPAGRQTRFAHRYRMVTPKGTLLVSLGLVPERNTLTFRSYLGSP